MLCYFCFFKASFGICSHPYLLCCSRVFSSHAVNPYHVRAGTSPAAVHLGTCLCRLMSVKLLGCLCYVCISCFLQAFHCALFMAVNIQFHGDSCLQKTVLAENALLWMILPFSIVLIFLALSVHSVARGTSRWKESHKNRYLLLNTIWSSTKFNKMQSSSPGEE